VPSAHRPRPAPAPAPAPAGTAQIRDAPAWRWRGVLLDVGRHFYPMAFIKRAVDAMAMLKLNTLHWHLTEDQASIRGGVGCVKVAAARTMLLPACSTAVTHPANPANPTPPPGLAHRGQGVAAADGGRRMAG
jgi:hypothetical protein